MSLLFLISCGHTVRFPGSLGQRPHVSGKTWDGHFDFSLHKTSEITLFSDISTTPPTREGTSKSISNIVFPALPLISIDVGIKDQFDVYFNGALGLRWQFLGNPSGQNWNATLFGGMLGNRKVRSGYNTSNSPSTEYSAETVMTGAEYGASLGYGFQHVMVYGTIGQQSGTGDTTITQPSASYKYSDSFSHTVATIGLTNFTQADWIYGILELSSLTTKWESKSTSVESGLLGLGVKW